MTFRTLVSIVGFGLAGVYAAAGLVELVALGDARVALLFGAGAAVTAGLVALLLPLLAPRGGDSGDDDDDGGPGGGGGPPSPPWWPDFERRFWSHVDEHGRRRGARRRERTPA